MRSGCSLWRPVVLEMFSFSECGNADLVVSSTLWSFATGAQLDIHVSILKDF